MQLKLNRATVDAMAIAFTYGYNGEWHNVVTKNFALKVLQQLIPKFARVRSRISQRRELQTPVKSKKRSLANDKRYSVSLNEEQILVAYWCCHYYAEEFGKSVEAICITEYFINPLDQLESQR